MAERPQQPASSEEDEARAHCYALISRLFYAPPDGDFVKALADASRDERRSERDMEAAHAPQDDASLPLTFGNAFLALQRAACSTDVATLRQEYDDIFIGAGKALVTPYTSGYGQPSAPDRYLVALRERLAAWGLARRHSVSEVEDHVSGICDAMRWLIESARVLEEQRAFFDEYVYTPVGLFCDATEKNSRTEFYRAAAAFTRAFLAVEKEGFELYAAE